MDERIGMKIIEMVKTNLLVRSCYYFFIRFSEYFITRHRFAKCEEGVRLTPPYKFIGPKNIFIGKNVAIGSNAMISALNAKFICAENCAIAEGLTVHTGDHARIVGKFVTDITEDTKPKGLDKDVIVQENVWIGSNVTLLAGSIVGRGSTIAAGAVVTKSIPPYSVCGGIPARFIKFYWTIDQIMEHELKLYPQETRLSREYLESLYAQYGANRESQY